MHVPPSIIALVILSMVYCNVCHVTGPWTTGRSLSRHQVQCRRKKQELTIARAAAEAAVQLNNPPTDILYNFIEVDPIQEEPQAPPPLPLPPPSPEPQLSAAGRRVRPRKLPRRYRQDDLPELPPAAVPEPITPSVPNEPAPSFRRSYYTQPNSHGLYKIYPSRPSRDPDGEIILEDLCDSPFHLRSTVQNGNHDILQSAPISIQGTSDPPAPWFPFLSATVARLMCWFYGGSNQKSAAELDSLVHAVILQEDFDKEDLTGFTCRRETDRLDHGFDTAADSLPNTTQSSAEDSLFNQSKGWQTCTARIRLPADKVKHSEDEAPEFEVKGILLRPLLDVMRESFQGPSFEEFHLTPFEYCYCSDLNTMVTPEDAPFHEPFSPLPPGHQHVYGEVYTSSAMMEAHLGLPSDPNIESVVAAQMFWSDSTHLASFGNASLWPLYTLWGNQSKYTRARPTANACNHQAYIPSLPDNLADQYRNHFGVPPSAQMLTHLKRELMHAVWGLLLTPEYIDAYAHGIIIKCFDGIERRIFPRILTYSADYPEKILLATIKYLGGCPCPRCLVKKADIPNLGLQKDMKTRERSGRKDSPWLQRKIDTVRDWIFSKGRLVAGSAVDKVLKAESLVPTRNAFSRLRTCGFNFYSMFVPDLLHEFELGVWKAVFTHCVRILHVIGGETVSILNERFRKVPTFGRTTIRRFHNNAAAMKKLAGRDFEDLLQCAIPVFEGLLPAPHDKILLDLLFILAEWHALAKLRMHTDETLENLTQSTKQLGQHLRKFRDQLCPGYSTKELPREKDARVRRTAAKSNGAQRNPEASNPVPSSDTSPVPKLFNLVTYKLHALGDYVRNIILFGTTDSYSTQIGELAHRRVKRFYARTNKNKYTRQVAKLERRHRLLRAIRRRLNGDVTSTQTSNEHAQPLPINIPERLPPISPQAHHQTSEERRTWKNIYKFISEHEGDPAVHNFVPRLKQHLLARLRGLDYDGDEQQFTSDELNKVIIINDRVFFHKVLRINYTTYDGRRDQDSLNPRTHPDFITPSLTEPTDSNIHPDRDPYWYGRIIAIFHVEVIHREHNTVNVVNHSQRLEVLWVRWFGADSNYRSGWSRRRLHRIGFIPEDDERGWADAFGFLNPSEVIRGVHLIPAFHFGQTDELLPYDSVARHPQQESKDWIYHYVNMFVDRDMVMRYRGGGIGHRTQTKIDTLDPFDAGDELDEDPDEPMDVDDTSNNGTEHPNLVLDEDEADVLVNDDSEAEDADLTDEIDESELDLDADHDDEDEEEVEDIIAEEGYADY